MAERLLATSWPSPRPLADTCLNHIKDEHWRLTVRECPVTELWVRDGVIDVSPSAGYGSP